MAKSFAQYASQFLTTQQHGASSLSSSQPLFFSFTTDQESRAGNDLDSDLDDLDDPHLRPTQMPVHDAQYDYSRRAELPDDDDPYLRLDEDEQPLGASRYASQSIPLISSRIDRTEHVESPKGWLAHQTVSLQHPRSLSPSPPSTSSLSSRSPPIGIYQPPPSDHFRPPSNQPPPPPRTREPASLSLTESLLPRDGTVRPLDVFSLPDPRHVPPGRRKYNDYIWTAFWCTGISICVFFSILLLFIAKKPSNSPRLPYTTLLHTIPMITILTFSSAVFAYIHIFLLRIFVRPVVVATSVFIPATLLISAVWAFVGSFMWDGAVEPTWGETVGLRLFSLIPLILAILTARRLLDLPREIHSTSSLLNLTTQLLMANPYLLALSPAILLTTLIASIPFVTLIFRLVLIGYLPQLVSGGLEWHIKGWADWAIFGAVAIWLWTWGVSRGILRVTCAGVIGAWYFADSELPPPPPTSTHTIHAAIFRATSPSLGSIILGALLLTGIRSLSSLVYFLRWLPAYLPIWMMPFLRPLGSIAGLVVGHLENVANTFSSHALVYTGLTGDPFMPSARRSRALIAAVEAGSVQKYKRKFQTEPPLTLLTYTPLTLTFPFALMTYLFVAHTLGAPDQALDAALLAGYVTALVGLFCVGLVKDTADTLYLCYCIDKDVGERRRDEVFSAFEYELLPPNPSRSQPRPPPHPQPQTPTSRAPQPSTSREDSKPRLSQPSRFPSPSRRPAAAHDADIDPFEQDPLDDDEEEPMSPLSPLSPQRHLLTRDVAARGGEVSAYSVEPASESRHRREEEEEADVEDSQVFPGSGFFD